MNQYEQGEKFIAAVEAAGGQPLVRPGVGRPGAAADRGRRSASLSSGSRGSAAGARRLLD